jgi:hypothetical protein
MLLGNDGSLMYYDENGTVVHCITDYMEGLNQMVLSFYDYDATISSSHKYHYYLRERETKDIPTEIYENYHYYYSSLDYNDRKRIICGG